MTICQAIYRTASEQLTIASDGDSFHVTLGRGESLQQMRDLTVEQIADLAVNLMVFACGCHDDPKGLLFRAIAEHLYESGEFD